MTVNTIMKTRERFEKKARRKLRKHAKAEITRYAVGSWNAQYAKAYAYTLKNGYLYSGEYMSSGEEIHFDRFDGYCVIGSDEPVNLHKGESVTF